MADGRKEETVSLLDGATKIAFRSSYSSTKDEDNKGHPCHQTSTEEGLDKKARRKLLLASALCLLFMTGEIVGGVLANSLAIATDAAHLLTDFASFMISLFSIYMASRPATKKMSFGWHRAEVMGALVSVLMIWVVTGILFYLAVQRVVSGDFEINAPIMLITAAVGVGVNIIMGLSLHQHAHSHGGHGHSHGGHSKPAVADDKTTNDAETGNATGGHHSHRNKENINVKAAFIHVIGDFVQSVGILIAAIIIYFKPEWKLADPICTFLFSVLVLITTISILRETLSVLMEATPRDLNFNDVKDALQAVDGVKEVHNLRLWSLTTNKTALSAHLAIDSTHNTQKVLEAASRMVVRQFAIHESTIQIEEYHTTMDDCMRCKDPMD